MRLSVFSLAALGLLLWGCEDNQAPGSPDATASMGDAGPKTCTPGDDKACGPGMMCEQGFCVKAVPPDAGPGMGQLRVTPMEINFGAFALGSPVEGRLTLENVGDGPLKLLELRFEDDDQQEFAAESGEALPYTLTAGESMIVRVVYQAKDGKDDHVFLVIGNDGDPPSYKVPLKAEYKGQADISVLSDAKTNTPKLSSLDFGQVPVGSTQTLTAYIKNTGSGNAVLEVESIYTEPNPSTVYNVVTSTGIPSFVNRFRTEALCTGGQCSLPGTMCQDGLCVDSSGAPVDTIKIDIEFTPNQEGVIQERLLITSNDPDLAEQTYVITLNGEGIQAGLEVMPAPIDFGTIFLGYPKTQEVTLTSVGDDILTLQQISLLGTSPGITFNSSTALPLSLVRGSSVSVEINADPVMVGSLTGELQIVSTDPDLPMRNVILVGQAIQPPIIGTSTPAVHFGEVPIFSGGGYEEQIVVISNSGGSDLSFLAIGLSSGSSPDFTINPQTLPPLAPGGSVQLAVRYSPQAVGQDNGTLVIDTNDPANPQVQIPLLGQGTQPSIFLFKSSAPPIPASPIVFGDVYRGSVSQPITLTLQNTGVGNLIISHLGLTAGSSSDFRISNIPALPTYLAGASTSSITLTIEYAPGAEGLDMGAIEIRTNERAQPVTNVALSGRGVGCPTNYWDVDRNSANGCEYFCVQASPAVELCNAADDDCNGTIDEGFNLGAACNGQGQCGSGVIECHATNPAQANCSTNPRQSADQSIPEVCNRLDDDCNGQRDNGFDLRSDLNNCGTCGTQCQVANGSPVCATGNCAIDTCNSPYQDCVGGYPDGCESNTQTDLAHCGGCNIACTVANGSPVCASGNCGIASCNTGFFDCNSTYTDGCEASLLNDINTCGTCSTVCSVANGSPRCNSGSCEIAQCTAPWRDCNTSYIDGCETNTQTTIAHCGACGNSCSVSNGSPACNGGTCEIASCTAAFRDCNNSYADGCEINSANNTNHCGGCGISCSVRNGSPRCSSGSCEIAQCTRPFDDCNNNYGDGCETNLSNNVASCGACGNRCIVSNGTPACVGGGCAIAQCTAPWRDCNSTYGDGCETNTQTNLNHCGGCGISCSVANGSPTCNGGSCEIAQCTAPYLDCNSSYGDGCEINSLTNVNNCGGCGNVCNLANAAEVCSSGRCAIDSCQGSFRDCNSLPVDGCEIDIDSSLQHCGGCNLRCDFANASESCNTGTCTLGSCDAGWVNLNGDASDGCEYQCTVQAGPDLPDSSFTDSNCDGIDGDRSISIFVSPLGNDANTGRYGSPVRTLTRGITRATAAGFRIVLVAEGIYTGGLTLSNGISMYGGYNPTNWSRSFANNTIIRGNASAGNNFGIQARNFTQATTFDGFIVEVANNTAASGSVYGMHLRSTGSHLTLSNLTINAGNAGNGTNGAGGGSGSAGGNARAGTTGCDGCSSGGVGGVGGTSSCGRAGRAGGRGGFDNSAGARGGSSTSGTIGGGGGLGAQVCDTGACSSCGGRKGGGNGASGSTGGSGGNGGNGAGGRNTGAIISHLWQPGNGNNGLNGAHGHSGAAGGGGGGGADDCYINLPFGACPSNPVDCRRDRGGGGGGGGAGGCAGTRGTGGRGGGGSFGIFLSGSSPRISQTRITTGRGGNGGRGGSGAAGGAGGAGAVGGAGQDDSGRGGSGGRGGRGGSGGHGGGGAGGPSYGIYRYLTSNPVLGGGVAYTIGSAGSGGTSSGNAGQTGRRGNIN